MTVPAFISPFPAQKQAPAGWTYLDYPGADILIQATTKWEKGFRRECSKKEPWTVAWIEAMPADAVLWDVGASVGPYSLIAASRGLTVVAVEPSYSSYAAMVNNLVANRAEGRVTPICVGLNDRPAIEPFSYRSTEAGAASHHFGVQGAPKSAATVPTLALPMDVLIEACGLPAPTHIKIDVDGAETAVLAGSKSALIDERLQSVMIELSRDPALSAPCEAILREAGLTRQTTFDQRGGRPLGDIVYAVFGRGA